MLLERGGFGGVHASMMVHPTPVDIADMPYLASPRMDVHYSGKEAHASGAPERGINAADALTVAQVAIGLLRQHIRSTDRVHGIVTKGGDAPNVVPAHTSATYSVRARTLENLEEMRSKVLRCFEAGALASGCQVSIEPSPYAYSEVRNDPDILRCYKLNAEALGRKFADFNTAQLERMAGSTDMGNVSLMMPAIHPSIGIDSWPAVNHQPEFAAHAATPAADRAVIDGALAMAWTAIDIATELTIRDRLLGSETTYSTLAIPGEMKEHA